MHESYYRYQKNDQLQLNLHINYGAREEILDACRTIVSHREMYPDFVIDDQSFSKFLYTPDTPDPDLLIRTSGEKRLSNYLLWQMAYAELFFLDVLWPDFEARHLEQVLQSYADRERRFGGVL